MRRINNEDVSLKKKRDKRKIIHTILSILVILVMVRQFFMENYANVFYMRTDLDFIYDSIICGQKIKYKTAYCS